MNVKDLLAKFVAHVDAMSDDEVYASIQESLRLTSSCVFEVGDIGEYRDAWKHETESRSLPRAIPHKQAYMIVSSTMETSTYSIMNSYMEVPAA